jgi:hypothetical protein
MNIVFRGEKGNVSQVKFGKFHKVLKGTAIGFLITVATWLMFLLVFGLWFSVSSLSNEDLGTATTEAQELDVITAVADSMGVPAGPAVRLCEYLAGEEFSGVGLFKVKPGHVGWLEERFVPGAEVDLEDPVMNANIALGLISSFHVRGYSWEQAFLIYVYGWGELAPDTMSDGAKDFLGFVFGGDSDEW